MTNRLTLDQRNEVVTMLRTTELSLSAIGNQFGITRQGVHYIQNAEGVDRKNGTSRPRVHLKPPSNGIAIRKDLKKCKCGEVMRSKMHDGRMIWVCDFCYRWKEK